MTQSENSAQRTEIEQLRESVRRLNRRCQLAESALVEKLDEAKRSGGSLGRGLASWYGFASNKRLQDIAASLDGMEWDDLPFSLHRYRNPEDAKYAKASDFTDIRIARELPEPATPAQADRDHP